MMTSSLPWSDEVESLFENDLTSEFNIDDYHIDVKVIADSINPDTGKRITTLAIKIPRIILSEHNTHRSLSRNFSSSRAIPAKKLRKEAWEHPFVPIYWGANKSGMSADQQLTGFNLSMAKFSWKLAGKFAVMFHKMMEIVGVHKQTCNRIIEPWMSVVGTITSTEWDNFLRLRYDRNAQPEIIVLAKKIHDAIKASEPTVPENGIHLPFIDEEERKTFPIDQLIKISVARCCRTSYANCLGKKSQPEEDIKLYHRLLGNGHFSPFEHIALIPNHGRVAKELQYDLQRNFRGWYQLRAFIQPESNTKYLNKMYNIEL
jgi:hypothetical protein